jgi:hypothetical protein
VSKFCFVVVLVVVLGDTLIKLRACIQFGILPLQYITAECIHAVWYPATALQFGILPLQFGILPLQFGILPLQFGILPLHFGILPLQYGNLPLQYGDLPR